jgi:hypothetical protein
MPYFSAQLCGGLLLGLGACSAPTTSLVRTATRTAPSGAVYTLFYPDSLRLQIVTRRPDPAASPVQLSVAAAYTDLATNQPLDLLVCQGQVRQLTPKVGYLEGLLTVVGDTLTITHLPTGQAVPHAALARVRRQQGTLLLQELLVYQGQNQRGPGGSRFQRRALVEWAPQRFAVAESVADTLSMQQFGADLVALGARSALYLDMGDWDEGWYKQRNQVVALGHRRTETRRQSNWLIFTSAAAK